MQKTCALLVRCAVNGVGRGVSIHRSCVIGVRGAVQHPVAASGRTILSSAAQTYHTAIPNEGEWTWHSSYEVLGMENRDNDVDAMETPARK